MKLFSVIEHYGCWILAVFMLLFIITGLGITKNIMDPRLAKQLHENILPVPFYVLFLIHAFFPVRAKLIQWRLFKSERTAERYACALFWILLALCFWLHFR